MAYPAETARECCCLETDRLRQVFLDCTHAGDRVTADEITWSIPRNSPVFATVHSTRPMINASIGAICRFARSGSCIWLVRNFGAPSTWV